MARDLTPVEPLALTIESLQPCRPAGDRSGPWSGPRARSCAARAAARSRHCFPGTRRSQAGIGAGDLHRMCRTVPAITAKAAEVLREIWPDLRHVEISATRGHA